MSMFVKGLTHGMYVTGLLVGIGGGLAVVLGLIATVVCIIGLVAGEEDDE